MRRVENTEGRKYSLIKEYNSHGIYQEVCPNGYYVSQSYLITKGDIKIVSQSYNNTILGELLDAIDDKMSIGKYNLKVIRTKDNVYVVHPNGSKVI